MNPSRSLFACLLVLFKNIFASLVNDYKWSVGVSFSRLFVVDWLIVQGVLHLLHSDSWFKLQHPPHPHPPLPPVTLKKD